MSRISSLCVGLALSLALALACGGVGDPEADPDADPNASPEPSAPFVAPPAPAPATEETSAAERIDWPLIHYGLVPDGRAAAVPPPHAVLDVDLAPDGTRAVVVTGNGADTQLWTWDFGAALAPVERVGVREVAVSPFDGSVYLLTSDGARWFVERGTLDAGLWTTAATVYVSDAPLSSLVTTFTRYDGGERVFFARALEGGRTQILSAKRSGARPYEVTSPSGAPGELTAPELRNPNEEDWRAPPDVLRADSAAPLSVHPVNGSLLWEDGQGRLHRRVWDPGAGNWGADEALAGTWRTWSPNGWYQLDWEPGRPWVRLVGPDGGVIEVKGATFLQPPVLAANGRTLVGPTAGALVTVAVPAQLAPVRYLDLQPPSAPARAALTSRGLALTDTSHQQLYKAYDEILYSWPEVPTFASLDGTLEVLHAGFQAVFVRVERDVSRPRLAAFLDALATAAGKADERRVREIAEATQRILDGDYDFPEGERVKAERLAASELHGKDVDFGDFHPRGPYATSGTLSDYFRAFKYIDQLELTDAERASLAGDAALVEAWRAWIDAQAPYLSGTRYEGAFGDFPLKTPYLIEECTPRQVREHPRRVFPLSWGLDSEILERTVAHDDLGPACTVPLRTIPSGLDLMAGLGSPTARALLAPDLATWPALGPAHDALRERFAGDIEPTSFVNAWMRLLQLLGNDERVPEGVASEAWRSRLLETALASWASFRHTTVLVNEGSAAQMGGGGDILFEELSVEPVRGAVDPVPEAWAALAKLLEGLATSANAAPGADRLGEVLDTAARDTARLGKLAERQMRGEPLAEDDYRFIQSYAGTIEHPYLLASAAAADAPDQISEPEPMMRIVDVHTWNDPVGPPVYWHVAVGRPRAVLVLLGDRGLLTPVRGAVYSYYERANGERLDDAAWRRQVDTAERPAWVNPSLAP